MSPRPGSPWPLPASTWLLVPPIIGLLAGCALTGLPRAVDAVPVTRAEVDIDITQDSAHSAGGALPGARGGGAPGLPAARRPRGHRVRTPSMKAGDDCGDLLRGRRRHFAPRRGLRAGCRVHRPAAGHAARCDLTEPAQPSSDGGVLFYTGFYAAAAPGFGLRWHFAAAPGDYGIDEGRRHDAAWEVRGGLAYEGEKARGDQRDDEAWLAGQHALHYVSSGTRRSRRPQDCCGCAIRRCRSPSWTPSGARGPIAWKAYADAAGRQPAGQAPVVMLAMPAGQFGYHGDRSEGYMLRLAFAETELHTLESASTFVAHEVAHLWNHGVFGSDMARPGSTRATRTGHRSMRCTVAGCCRTAVRASSVAHRWLHDGARGSPASTLKPGWSDEDNPYDCGFALLLLGHARRHAADPAASPLGNLGHAAPGSPSAARCDRLRPVFRPGWHADARTTAARRQDAVRGPTYKADLAAYLALRESAAEPAAGPARRQTAANLMSAISRADCDGRLRLHPQDRRQYRRRSCSTTISRATPCLPVPASRTWPASRWWRDHALPGVLCNRRVPRQGVWRSGSLAMRACKPAAPQSLPDLPPLVVLPEDVLGQVGTILMCPAKSG